MICQNRNARRALTSVAFRVRRLTDKAVDLRALNSAEQELIDLERRLVLKAPREIDPPLPCHHSRDREGWRYAKQRAVSTAKQNYMRERHKTYYPSQNALNALEAWDTLREMSLPAFAEMVVRAQSKHERIKALAAPRGEAPAR